MAKAVSDSKSTPSTSTQALQVKPEKEIEYATAISLTGGFGKYQRKLLIKMLPISLSSVLSVNTIIYALPAFICEFSVSKYHQGLLLCAIYIGMVIGGFIWGVISDTIGRRRTLLFVLAWTTIFEVLSSFSLHFWFLFVCKVLSGLTTCGFLTTCYTYASEFVDITQKDTMIIRTGSSIALAFFIQPLMALLIIPRHIKLDIFHAVNINSWRLFILCCSIFPFLGLLSTLLLIEESPAFLLEEGNSEKSLKILRKIYSTNTGKPPETFPVRKLMAPKRESGITSIRRASTRLKPLLQDPYVLPVTIAYIFQGITMAAFSAIKLYHTVLFTVAVGAGQFDNVTLSDAHAKPFCELFQTQEIFLRSVHCTKVKLNDEVYLGAVIVGFTVFMSLFGTKLLIERFNKMVLFVIGHLTSAICMIIFPFSSWAYVLILMSIFFVCMQNCVTISISLIVNRVPPFMRGVSVGLIMVFGEFGVILGSQILPIGTNFSCISSFWIVTLLHVAIIPLMIVFARQPNPYEENERRLSEEAEALRYLMEPST